jgi:hypothetical protein
MYMMLALRSARFPDQDLLKGNYEPHITITIAGLIEEGQSLGHGVGRVDSGCNIAMTLN